MLAVLLVASLLAGCTQHQGDRRPDLAASGTDRAVSAIPMPFQPGVITTALNERDAAMTPDGSEFYFSIWSGSFGTIAMSRHVGSEWTRPEVVAFSGEYSDLEPFITQDGQQFYFASARPIGPGAETDDFNIWVADRAGNAWTEPRLVEDPVYSTGNEYYPSVTAAGILYFTSKREGSVGGEDIWRVAPTDSGFGIAEPVMGGVNTERDEFNAFVAPDESYLLFSSWGREDGFGGGDLYVSFADDSGTFGPALNLGSTINSSSLDYSPYVSPDGVHLFFSSRRANLHSTSDRWVYDELRAALSAPGNGAGDIFRVDASVLDSLRLVPHPGRQQRG
jgi:Tol biopolymer transport system component